MESKVTLRFLVPMRPISVNKMYRTFRGRVIKSAEGRKFEGLFNSYLAEFSSHAIDFLRCFNPETDALKVTVTSYILKSDFFTKRGSINKRCLDADNILKCVSDQVFSFIDLDDGLVTSVTSQKLPSDEDSVEIMLEKVDAPTGVYRPMAKANISGGLQ